jgi:ribosomal protein S18 acetylase RimI-like enzyme
LDKVGVLAGKLVRMHHAFDPARFMALPDPERGYARWMATQLEAREVILLVAEDEEGIAGYVYARLEPRNWDDLLDRCVKLHDIFVDERARKRGHAEALLRELVVRARARGAPRIVLMTAIQNTSAQRLFERFGFRTTMLEMTAEVVSP